MNNPKTLIAVVVVGILILGIVAFRAFTAPGDGSTQVEATAPPDATTIAQPLPGAAQPAAAGASSGPAVDAQGAPIIR